MAYYFRHETGEDWIGDNEKEAFDTLQNEMRYDLEDILELCLNKRVYERSKNA